MKPELGGQIIAALIVARMVGPGVFISVGFQVVSLSSGLAMILLRAVEGKIRKIWEVINFRLLKTFSRWRLDRPTGWGGWGLTDN
ncbi:MAG TPA: hypothetical protein PLP57_08870 [Candidatus Saccharicenans sp.]|jgi:hypothetical protein|nr:hypothetical protein [Candidatus Saccharicenans sp.]HRD02735.1 hypothetical protein [Candidatus Saccharicenans sp.]